MRYAKIVNNVVVQVQPNKDVNCEVEVNDNVTCGMELVDDTYIIPVIELTSQELYDQLITEGEQVFDDFRKMLSEASSPYVILGTIPTELQVLTQTMLDAKTRITDGLSYYLSVDDVTNLKAFTFQTAEAEQLRQAIKDFK